MDKRCFFALSLYGCLACFSPSYSQSLRVPWNGYAHDSQHGAVSAGPTQSLNRILWSTPVDLAPDYNWTGGLFIHYGSPAVTRSNTVIVPVKVGLTSGFMIEAITGATGVTNWTQPTDYALPPHNWIPTFSPTLPPKNRLYFPG